MWPVRWHWAQCLDHGGKRREKKRARAHPSHVVLSSYRAQEMTCNAHLILRPLCRASCMLPQRVDMLESVKFMVNGSWLPDFSWIMLLYKNWIHCSSHTICKTHFQWRLRHDNWWSSLAKCAPGAEETEELDCSETGSPRWVQEGFMQKTLSLEKWEVWGRWRWSEWREIRSQGTSLKAERPDSAQLVWGATSVSICWLLLIWQALL